MLRAKGFASGNGLNVGAGAGGRCWPFWICDSVSSAPTAIPVGANGGTPGTAISRVVAMVDEGGGNGGDCSAGGGNGGVVDGKRSGGTNDGSPVRTEAGSDDDDDGCGARGRRDSGEGGGRTKDVGNSDAGTVEGITSVSKEDSTRLLDRRLGRVLERFADAEEGLDALAAFRGDLCTTFALDLERVFRGERRDGPGCAVVGGARFSGRVEESISRFFEVCCSSCSGFDYKK
jgi:hypothetical protein